MRTPLLRIVYSAKWGEGHRQSQAFLGYAEKDGLSPVNAKPSFFPCDHPTVLGFPLVVFFSPAGFASAAVIACVIASHQSPL